MIGYYDYVLGLIPAALVGVSGALVLMGFSLTTALPVGATIAFAVMCHAMFVRTPSPDDVAGGSGDAESLGASTGGSPTPGDSAVSGGTD